MDFFKVAIITRTFNRPLLLERAALSIKSQTFQNYVWVIVNDGDSKPVERIISCYPKNQVLLINNSSPVGMEKASNMGIIASNSEYVVIHDDDDSWDKNFLQKTIEYLETNTVKNGEYGVITYTDRIIEKIEGETIKKVSQDSFNSNLNVLSLFDMLIKNRFPPISFLFRRCVFDEIGYYDESLPVLGDWDFNIRFMLHYNIGIIPEVLAYYHHRCHCFDSYSLNSVTGGNDLHIYYDNYLRNKYLRQDIQNNTFGIGTIMNLGLYLDNNNVVNSISPIFNLNPKKILKKIFPR